MNALFFDVETTGKADFNLASDADIQPRIVQLAALLCDEKRKEVASINLVIKTSVNIPEEASAIHGITNNLAKDVGVPLFYALQVFWSMAKHADVFVAHNIQFDWFLIKGESHRMVTDIHVKPQFCTMKSMTPICQIPGRYEDYKYPRLIEAYRHAFGKEFDGAHDAMADVHACKDIYYWLKDRVAPIPAATIPQVSTESLAAEMRKAVG